MKEIIYIFWHDLSEEKQQELLEAGYDNQNVVDGVFSLTQIYLPPIKIWGKEE